VTWRDLALLCRERQRDTISSLEAELSDKLAQLQVLAAENELLKLRSTVLEATVKGSECQVGGLRQHSRLGGLGLGAWGCRACWACFNKPTSEVRLNQVAMKGG
jgi:hypothetical protein